VERFLAGAELASAAASQASTSARAWLRPSAPARSGAELASAVAGAAVSVADAAPREAWRAGGASELARRKDPSLFLASSGRGVTDHAERRDYAGEEARFGAGEHSERPEIFVTPLFDRADRGLQERARAARMLTPHRRELRTARSPRPCGQARCGLSSRSELSSRCEEMA
jgi:hypothetical protein